MKSNLLQVILILISGSAIGQNFSASKHAATNSDVQPCSQHIRTQQMQMEDPERFATIGKRHNAPIQEHYAPTPSLRVTGIIYTIPVVFHVLHNNGSENISDAQILDALEILNRDFRRLNADADLVHSAFQGMPSDVEIEFKLATVAPNGNCFNGITRTQSNLTNNGDDGENQIQAIVNGNNVYQGVWQHNRYLNIYIANDIGGAAGYTFLPNGGSGASVSNMYYNGIFVLENYVGSIGTSNVGRSRTLTHEVGHWLNLPHVWGAGNSPGGAGNCSGDDGIQDTPNCIGVTTCNLNSNTCNSDDAYWGMAMRDNVENYMDYSYCSKMYTQGQVDEMRDALNSSVGGRSNVKTTANLQLVGAIPGSSLCSIDFEASQTGVCAGSTVTYTPNTTNGISSYSWSFPGGLPATSSATNPTVTYNTPGTHNATLVVTSSANGTTYTEAKTAYITVNSGTSTSLPISEGFVNAGIPSGWTIFNPNSSTTWVRTTAAGVAPTTGNSIMFDNFNIDDATDDEFRITNFSTVGMSSSQLSFDVAYAPYNTINFDGLEVLVSTDCGGSYTSVFSKSNTVLATRPATTSLFTPTAAQWRNEVVDLSPFVGQGVVTVAFRNLAGYGNRLFVDNISITGTAASPTANFSVSSTGNCVNQNVTFTDASVMATSWNWNFGAGATPATAAGAGPHSVTYSTSGIKTVSLTINGSNTSNQNVVVNSLPNVSFGALPTVCVNHSPVILNQGSPAGGTYSGTGVTGNQFNPSTAGTGVTTLTYNYTNGNGCSASQTSSITVDGCLGIEEYEANLISVFPNPSDALFTVKSEGLMLKSVSVCNQLGQMVYDQQSNQMQHEVNLMNFANGVYTIRVNYESGVKNIRVILNK